MNGIFAGLMIFSLWLPWVDLPFAPSVAPAANLGQFGELLDQRGEIPFSVILFLLSFPAAALQCGLGLLAANASRLIGLFAGGAPFVGALMLYAQIQEEMRRVPFDLGSFPFGSRATDELTKLLGPGFYLFFGSALVVLILSLTSGMKKSVAQSAKAARTASDKEPPVSR